ncbi:MAG: HAMP domain-containing histidine kinase [Coprococcus sp.]|nr:HAMP domain-containing histidine kinase [Coprococcus sp.]
MNKWYQSPPCKGILLALELVFGVTAFVCLAWILSFPAESVKDILSRNKEERYEDTAAFEEQLRSIAGEIVWMVPQWEAYKTEGAYDEEKLVDILEYQEKRTISGENQSGLAYKLGDLVKWYNEGFDSYENESDRVIVCKRPDNMYQYFYTHEFRELVAQGELCFGNKEAKEDYDISSDEEVLDALTGGWGDVSLFSDIRDREGNQLYTSCWTFDGFQLKEKYAPDGAENILEIVNTDAEWNGRLSEVMDAVQEAGQDLGWNVQQCQGHLEQWSEGNTNISYLLYDAASNQVFTNRAKYQKADEWKRNIEDLKKSGKYVVVTPKLGEFESNMSNTASVWKSVIGSTWTEDYVFAFAVDTGYPIQDNFYVADANYGQYAPLARTIFLLGALTGLGAIICLVWLTIVSGRSNKKEGVSLQAIDKMPTECFLMLAGMLLYLVIAAAIAVVKIEVYQSIGYASLVSYEGHMAAHAGAADEVVYRVTMDGWTVEHVIVLASTVFLCVSAVLISWLGFIRRMKAGTLWSNSILKRLLQFGKKVFSHIDVIWKGMAVFVAFVFVHHVGALMWDPEAWWLVMLASEAAAFIYLVKYFIGRDKIKKGIVAIAEGQVDYQINLDKMQGELLQVAEAINKIGDGLERAVEESIKNERMKTDLITNVSHDIKTPLTSIINYIELLKRENFEEPRIQNYLKVLEEKAQRLKTLTEDVVEASKVSSGNVKLEKMNLNLAELINQASAEFEERFDERNLYLVLNLPKETALIYADGRRMWRVLSNIFNNAAKYAMEGTRVYVDLLLAENKVCLIMKNISEQPLNISADELTERFIRGDISRSTEGSGLGLSIAKNLTELQGGSFELYLDGDLFKVKVEFARVYEIHGLQKILVESDVPEEEH